MRIKKHDELRQNRLSKIFFHNPTFFDTCKQTKTKVGGVVGCIFEVECSVGGFLILKQIIKSIHVGFSSQGQII
jgi:hypothetical protein